MNQGVRGFAAAWLFAGLVWALGLPGAAEAQQPQRDPFNGQFGVFELASPPAEAANLAKLMGESMTALQPQRPGELDVYVISASLWGEPVFEREASQAAEILSQHFGAQGRSIVLSAGGQGPRRFPAADPNNISAAIGQVGSLIDPSEDLVVIFLTTHGGPDGSAALRETNRMAGALRPAHLRDMMAASGIRNRLIIVSACYSGAFIAPLADDNTIVLTAAASDRTSFGCQPQRDWTFFGDAYFNNALRNGASIVPAFDQAKTLIERWEREQNLTPPSNPQRFVGPHAADMVRRAERAAH